MGTCCDLRRRCIVRLFVRIAAFALVPAGAASADTITLPAVRDNTLYEAQAGTVSNGEGSWMFSGMTAKGSLRRALLRFDFSAIPPGATIDSVTLTLYMSRTTAPVQNMRLHRVTADWGEGTSNGSSDEGRGTAATPGDATWLHSFYPGTLWASVGGDYTTTESAVSPVAGIGFYSWSSSGMVADVQAWLEYPNSNFGWVIVGNEAAQRTTKRFNTRENAVATQRPAMVVHFTPQVFGACCGTEAGCSLFTPEQCETERGTYVGDGTTCLPDPCAPPPTGGCCAGDGSCTELTQAECATGSGTYQGDGTGCSPNGCPPPPPTGGCCAFAGACTVRTEAECLAESGAYQGDATSCSLNVCPPPPSGGCCAFDGSCLVSTEASCLSTGGTYQGDKTSCSPNGCPPPPTGACCAGDGSCAAVTEAACDAQAGTYQGDGTMCSPDPCPPPPTGACCASTGGCAVLTQSACLAQGGSYDGDATSCDGGIVQCPDCYSDAHCDDGDVCDGVETCVEGACVNGTPPACGDGLFCNGVEACDAVFGCFSPGSPCGSSAICHEESDTCERRLQPRAGEPLAGLTVGELGRFHAGKARFAASLTAGEGLGPIFNQDSCGACHSTPMGGSGLNTVTRFGRDTGGVFDPLAGLGGSLLQAQVIDEACPEAIPPEANVVVQRITPSTLGFGLVEAVADAALRARELSPPSGVSGRTQTVVPFETPGMPRIGRFGWKSQVATVLTFSADAAQNEMGLTNRFLPTENAPNGDTGALVTCDLVADPEDSADGAGFEFVDRVTDFQRFLAAPPQTPRSGMSGEALFTEIGCAACHVSALTTGSSGEAAIADKLIKPYSDFLLHDMGALGDGIVQGDAAGSEMRTAPLWGLRFRTALLHDGRATGGTLADCVQGAIGWHAAEGSEAAGSALAFAALSMVDQARIVAFLDSLGRAEFDHEGDNDVDLADYDVARGCLTGPGVASHGADDVCAVSDFDSDGDVDLLDVAWMQRGFTGAL